MLPCDTKIGLLSPITWPIPPKSYGPWERGVYELGMGLVKRGYKNVTLFATKQAQLPGINTVAIIDKPLSESEVVDRRALEIEHIRFALDQAKNLDIVNNHFNCLPLPYATQLRRPIITTLHGAGQEPEARKVFEQFAGLPYISMTDAERQYAPSLNYIDTVPNGIDFEEFTPQSSISDYLVYAGRITPAKGVHHAVKLASSLKRKLYLAGPIDPGQETYFSTQIQPFIDGKQIFYLGPLTREEVKKLVGQAQAFLALNEGGEAFGRSIAESMACGTPVIATPKGSHTELVIPGVTGLLVENVRDAVRKFPLIPTVDRHLCRQKARELFSMDIMVDGYLRVFSKVMNDFPSAP